MKPISLLATLFAGWFLFCGVLCEHLGEPDPQYQFQIAIHIYPEKPQYKVGDSIWFDIKFPNNKLRDSWSGDSILIENASVPLNMAMAEHLIKAPFDSTLATFFIVDSSGTVLVENSFENFHLVRMAYGCTQDDVHFRFGICLKKAGVYNVFPNANGTSEAIFGSGFDCITGGGGGDLALLDYIYEVNDVHKEIYEKVKTPSDPHTFISGEISMEALIFGKRVYWFEGTE